MRAKFIFENHMRFKEESDPVKDMGIGDKEFLIKNTLNRLAKKHEFESYSRPRYTDIETIEEYNYENVKILRCWYKQHEDNFQEIILFTYNEYDDSDELKYGIWETTEYSVSCGDELIWPTGEEFTDDYWSTRNID